MEIHGFQKTTLLDYPGHIASTIFLGGCNFRCPFCHNASLVLSPSGQPTIPEEEVFKTLKKRVGIIEGICITGGEPTLYPGLFTFIHKMKELGFLVKLDTNGNNPHIIKELTEKGYLDYIAMDIKNSREKYGLSCGINPFNLSRVDESVTYLLSNPVDYEFRTTVVREHHTHKDIQQIGEWTQGAKAYYLQPYKDSDDIIQPGLSSPTKQELLEYKDILSSYVQNVSIRGID
ncbi:anaerobic ribonucleoside-triphosphate reductase activating protein [Anaerocolumna sedimenticola]|uniref:Anaerobic ribonucleoside-triphosphate reductase activating protein n=1 Tax=Anaerocolumna sedimenticola TaxID=2696063 RepID=A0A6P1TGT7_9FIRM|nr:anaerobic ribonucleoside-triphosphate reductase activating protein [Anaerocolumna sedimenticola]QHQ60364.1 anaerobic ribonucleoside-triphosphate reductase activating protein [Anaerocolumna sedimenticola]